MVETHIAGENAIRGNTKQTIKPWHKQHKLIQLMRNGFKSNGWIPKIGWIQKWLNLSGWIYEWSDKKRLASMTGVCSLKCKGREENDEQVINSEPCFLAAAFLNKTFVYLINANNAEAQA